MGWKIAKFLNSLGYHSLLKYLRANGRSFSIIKDLTLEGFSKIKARIVLDNYQKITDTKALEPVKNMINRLNVSKIIIILRKKPKGISWRRENVGEIIIKGLKIENIVDPFKIKNLKDTPKYIVKIYEATLGHPFILTMLIDVAKRKHCKYFEPISYEALKIACRSRNIYPILSKIVNSDIVYEINDKYSLHDLIKGFLRVKKPFDEKKFIGKSWKPIFTKEDLKCYFSIEVFC